MGAGLEQGQQQAGAGEDRGTAEGEGPADARVQEQKTDGGRSQRLAAEKDQ